MKGKLPLSQEDNNGFSDFMRRIQTSGVESDFLDNMPFRWVIYFREITYTLIDLSKWNLLSRCLHELSLFCKTMAFIAKKMRGGLNQLE